METPRDNFGQAATQIVAAMFVIGLIDNFVAQVAEFAGLWQFHATRAAMAIPILGLVAWALGWSLIPKRWGAVLLRAVASTLAMLVYFGCLAFLPIGHVAAGLFTSPIFVLILSVLVFGERLGPRRVIGVAVGFAGILLILQPSGEGLTVLAAIPVIAGALYAVSVMLTRHHCADEHPACLLMWFFVILGSAGAFGGLALTWWGDGTGFVLRPWVADPGPAFWGFTLVQAVGSLGAIGMLVRGYQIASPSRVAAFEYTLLIFAPVWAFVLWGQAVSWVVVAGMVLIVLSGLIVARSAQT